MVHIVGISGSLRKASTNTGILRAIAGLLPKSHTMDIVIPDLPLFNQDVEAVGLPKSVHDFRARLKHADAFIFSCPEYNYAISGALKNAIDWGSRGDKDGNLFNDKAGAAIAAGGQIGGARAMLHMADTAVYVNLHMMNHPNLPIKIFVEPRPFDQDGNLLDEAIRKDLKKFVDSFVMWQARIGRK